MAVDPTTNLKIARNQSEHDASKIAVLNTAANEFDTAVAGMLSLSVAGAADVTLSRVQGLNKVFKFTGVLTDDIVVFIPAALGSSRKFIVWNATTGAFTLTVKTTTGGSTGVVIVQTKKSVCFHDGTDVTVTDSTGAGTGDALIANGLGQFAITTSAALASVMSNETGTGLLVFNDTPTLITPIITGAIALPDGVRQTFNPNGTVAGLNVGSQAGDPSTPINGDVWYDSTANTLDARINGATVNLGAGGGGTPGGSNTQVQFNDSSAFGGDAGLTYNKTTDTLTVTGGFVTPALTLGATLITPTGTELNFVDGVTSAIQTQLDAKVDDGAVTTSGLTMATARLLGRTTASTGAVEQITVGAGLSLSAGALTATGSGSGDVVGPASSTDNAVARYDSTTGKLLQNSVVTIADTTGDIVTPGTITSGDGTIAGEAKLFELAANGTNYISTFVADAITNTLRLKYPNADPAAGQALVYGAPSSNIATGAWVTVGYLEVPQNSQSAAYTAVLSDTAKHIFHPVGDNNARTFTIPANSSVAYPVGTTLSFVNKVNTVTIAITTDTLTLAGAGTTGSRTLAANGIATALKITSTEWMISGTGLT